MFSEFPCHRKRNNFINGWQPCCDWDLNPVSEDRWCHVKLSLFFSGSFSWQHHIICFRLNSHCVDLSSNFPNVFESQRRQLQLDEENEEEEEVSYLKVGPVTDTGFLWSQSFSCWLNHFTFVLTLSWCECSVMCFRSELWFADWRLRAFFCLPTITEQLWWPVIHTTMEYEHSSYTHVYG